MPFILSKEMTYNFEREGKLTLENFLPEAPFNTLKNSLETHFKSSPKDFKSRYLEGRDLFRTVPEIKKTLLKKDVQKLVGELCQEQKLLFAFDQLLDCRKDQPFIQTSMLQDIMSVSPLRLGVLLCLDGTGDNEHFPKQPNEALFFLPWRPVSWNEAPKGQLFLMFGYALIGALYKENSNDPNTNLMKRLHYQPNEPLKAKTHPLVKS